MYRFAILATSALIALGGSAFANEEYDAQEQGSTQGSAMNAQTGSAAAGASAETGDDVETGSIGSPQIDTAEGVAKGQPNYATLVSSINASEATATRLENLEEVNEVLVVSVADLETDVEGESIDSVLDENRQQLGALRDALGANSQISSRLESEGVDSDNIVAADVDAVGNVTIYTRG